MTITAEALPEMVKHDQTSFHNPEKLSRMNDIMEKLSMMSTYVDRKLATANIRGSNDKGLSDLRPRVRKVYDMLNQKHSIYFLTMRDIAEIQNDINSWNDSLKDSTDRDAYFAGLVLSYIETIIDHRLPS